MSNAPKQLTPFTSENAAENGAKGGRNKRGSKHISTHIQEMLEDETFSVKLKDGQKFEGRPMEAIIRTAMIQAMSGDAQAREWLAKHGYRTNINLNVENPVERLLVEFGVRKAIDDDRKAIEPVHRTRKDAA